jgi:hypothetical protein
MTQSNNTHVRRRQPATTKRTKQLRPPIHHKMGHMCLTLRESSA